MYSLGCSRCGYDSSPQLGAIAVAPAIATAVNIGQKLFGGPSPDDARFAKIQEWYGLGLQGDEFAECKLKYYSGRFGSFNCGAGVISGWATQAAKDYSFLAYTQLLKVKAGQLPESTPLPKPGSKVPSMSEIGDLLVKAGVTLTEQGYRMGSPLAQKAVTGVQTGALVLGGLAVVMLARSRRR